MGDNTIRKRVISSCVTKWAISTGTLGFQVAFGTLLRGVYATPFQEVI